MKFTKLHSILIIGLVLLSLLGLSVIQFSWLQGAKVIQEEKIQEQLTMVMEKFKISFDDSQMVIDQQFEGNKSYGDNSYKTNFTTAIKSLMDSILSAENFKMDFEFGLTTCKSDDYSYFSNPLLEAEIKKGSEIKLGDCSFLSNSGTKDHLHFFAIFPQKEQLIFREMSLAIGSSILFMLLLAGAFCYTLFTIFQQKKLSEMKNDFINNLSHEFKTPIASISLAAKTLQRLAPVRESNKALNYIHLIDQEGKRLENHIDKVLQMATIDSGNFALDKQEVNIHEVIEKVKKSLSLILEKSGGEINLRLQALRPNIYADAIHLFNILYNLVDNAIKYNNNKPLIFVDCSETDEGLKISISDNGIGMSREVQQQAFDRFYRRKTGNVHDVKGFGLGLAYVKKMMEAHQGRIELDSQPGRGSTFSLIFPTA